MFKRFLLLTALLILAGYAKADDQPYRHALPKHVPEEYAMHYFVGFYDLFQEFEDTEELYHYMDGAVFLPLAKDASWSYLKGQFDAAHYLMKLYDYPNLERLLTEWDVLFEDANPLQINPEDAILYYQFKAQTIPEGTPLKQAVEILGNLIDPDAKIQWEGGTLGYHSELERHIGIQSVHINETIGARFYFYCKDMPIKEQDNRSVYEIECWILP